MFERGLNDLEETMADQSLIEDRPLVVLYALSNGAALLDEHDSLLFAIFIALLTSENGK